MNETRPTGALWRFRVLAGAYAVTSYGTYLNMVALNLFVFELTGSALYLGVFLAVRLVSGSVAGLVAARLLARVPHRRVMLLGNLAQATTLLLLVVAPAEARVFLLFAMAVTNGCGGSLFMVALRSSVPELVGPERRTWANSLVVTGRSLGMVAGFASAGLVVSLWGYDVAFLIDAASFLVCAAAIAWLHHPVVAAPADPVTRSRPRVRGGLAGLGGLLAGMVLLRGLDALGSSSHNAALPVYSALLDPARPATFVSWFLTSWAIGNILAQQGIRLAAKRGRGVGVLGFALGTIVMSTAFIAGFAGFPLVLTTVIALVAGCADGLTEVSYTNHLQTLQGSARDRVFGLSATVENLGFGLGMVVNAALLDRYSPLPVVAGSHGVAVLAALVFLGWLWWRGRTVPDGLAPHRDHRDGAEVPRS
ncbi:MFS family permease [Crossiella equi]|uniref:MFS family permease n=1 Tax=Crossiella equi TaxID=130796 RepID=A0ABS5AS94_9PSEU|nr:MFS transporter [Crossiella equi]MBP2479434.1 MFS family permease [Crossiella equi]